MMYFYDLLHGNTGGYKGWQEVTRADRVLEGVTGGYKELQKITKGHKGLKGVTGGYKRISETFFWLERS